MSWRGFRPRPRAASSRRAVLATLRITRQRDTLEHLVFGRALLAINNDEARIVRRTFEMARDGMGKALIAKPLNAERAVSPRPQRRRACGWTPSSGVRSLVPPAVSE